MILVILFRETPIKKMYDRSIENDSHVCFFGKTDKNYCHILAKKKKSFYTLFTSCRQRILKFTLKKQ